MKKLLKIPFVELLYNILLTYYFILFHFVMIGFCFLWDGIPEYIKLVEIARLYPSLLQLHFILYAPLLIFEFLFIDFSNNELFLKIICKWKQNNLLQIFPVLFPILLFIIVYLGKLLYDYSLGKPIKLVVEGLTLYFGGICESLFLYIFFFTLVILLWRFVDLFKNTTFAKKLRRIKRRVLGRIWPWLFKVYCKNKAIRNRLERCI